MNRFVIVALALIPATALAAGKHFAVYYPPSEKSGELSVESNYYLWIPDGAVILRGVIVHQHGCGDGAERGGVTASHDLHWQALARKWNCALLGSSYRAKGKNCRLWCDPRNGSEQTFLRALADFGKQSGHPELSSAPWCLWGHSGGGFWASLMQVKHPERIVGIWLRSGTAFAYWEQGEIDKPEIPAAAYRVPVMCNPGIKEKGHERFRRAWDGTLSMFNAYRRRGDAPIGFAPDPRSSHDCGDSRYLAIPFFDVCLEMRLPKLGAARQGLRPVDWKQAWLADPEGRTAFAAADYKGDRKSAVWLADERFAKAWMRYVSDRGPADTSAPPQPQQVARDRSDKGDVVLTWTATADFESGLGGFRILRNGKAYAKLPEKPSRRFGRPLFQAMSYHDTPNAPPPEMRFVVPPKDAGKGDTFAIATINTAGLESQPANAVRRPSTVRPGAKLVEVYGDPRFFEGPTWDPQGGRLYFTAFGKDNQQILRLDGPGKVSVWLDKTEGVNGTCLSIAGRLLGAQAYGHRVMSYKFGSNGPADSAVLYFDAKLNQPNDVCEAPNGDVYFTDPDFKNRQASAVYRLKNGKATKVIDDMPVPNGLITSLDGKTLYVGDSHEMLWRSYPIRPDGTVGPGKVFFNPQDAKRAAPDGMTIDEKGNLYFSGRGGVWVVAPSGKPLGLIAVPEFCSNVCFGGKNGRTLYLTCSKKVYSVQMTVRGVIR